MIEFIIGVIVGLVFQAQVLGILDTIIKFIMAHIH